MSTESAQVPGPLPERAVLVHIGPYKTGTTAIQSSLHQHRAELAAAGVTYPGGYHRQMRPSWALLGRSRVGEDDVPMSEWDDLVAEVRRAPGRVVISSEDFSSARPEHVQRLVDDLGRDLVHVLVVARRLDRLLPSAWQERVKSVNETRTYDAWLREVLSEKRGGAAARVFWHNHGLDGLVRRWRAVLPPEQVVVLVTDEDDRGRQQRTFERLLGLPEGLLTPGRHSNTSLSMERIEFCRQVNLAVEAHGWVGDKRLNPARRSLLAGLRSAPLADWETLIPPLPRWTLDRLTRLSDARAEAVAGADATVLGDPDLLRWHGAGVGDDLGDPPDTMPTAAAAGAMEQALAGSLKAFRRQRRPRASSPAPSSAPSPASTSAPPVTGVPGRELVRELGRRVRRRLRRR
ncbi:MAG TPA: hypothetical protein VGK78_05835 [Nocardioides sp.]|uniref:hypothetical protein n=1 Tax=Nocardioides sp. TaxID=35761 RepID=UPI002F41ADB6